MTAAKLKRALLPNLPYAALFWFFSIVGKAYRSAYGKDVLTKIMATLPAIPSSMSPPATGKPFDLLIGLIGAAAVSATVYAKKKTAKKWRKDVEYGSARWGTPEEAKPFADPDPDNNIILTRTETLSMDSRPASPKHARNKNVLVVGGSGSGKTRCFVKANLMQCQSAKYPASFVVTDPKGALVRECGTMLARHGYRIKALNTVDFARSMHYNPFKYIRSEKDILKLATTLIANTKGDGREGEDFWAKAETLLYCALIGFIWYEAPPEEKNINTLVGLVNSMEIREGDESFKNFVDCMFDELEAAEPEHFAVRQYKKYKLAAGKTAKSILISCGARLAPFDIKEMRELVSYDELGLDMIGDEKTALFVIISDTDDSFNFIVAIMYSQLFNLLCDKADNQYGGRLPVHVRCLLDEFANIGTIPKFEKLVATIRSREISACVVLQAQSQLKAVYKENMETIIGNMDSRLFLGGAEKTTLKDLAESLGKETIDIYSNSITKGNSPSFGQNYQKHGKELMSVDEIAVMDGSKCILQLRGVRPFLSDKYDITKHKNYKYLSDADKSNEFHIEAAMSTKLKVKPEDGFEYYSFDMEHI